MDATLKNIDRHWKSIEAELRATGVKPVDAMEAIRAQLQGLHHDPDLAQAVRNALGTAVAAAEIAKIEAKNQNKSERRRA